MWNARCRECGIAASRSVPKSEVGDLARSSRARGWHVLSWSLALLVTVAVVVSWYWNQRVEREHAFSPIVGDRWTILVEEWPEPFYGAERYMHAVVEEVSDVEIRLAACETTYSKSDDARRKCNSFPVEMEAIDRGKLGAIYDDAVSRVDSSRDDLLPLQVGFGVCAGLVFVWRILAGAWKRRVGIAEV